MSLHQAIYEAVVPCETAVQCADAVMAVLANLDTLTEALDVYAEAGDSLPAAALLAELEGARGVER